MSEPVRITKSATASDLVECLGWLGDEIQQRVVVETRADVADMLRDSFIDPQQDPHPVRQQPRRLDHRFVASSE